VTVSLGSSSPGYTCRCCGWYTNWTTRVPTILLLTSDGASQPSLQGVDRVATSRDQQGCLQSVTSTSQNSTSRFFKCEWVGWRSTTTKYRGVYHDGNLPEFLQSRISNGSLCDRSFDIFHTIPKPFYQLHLEGERLQDVSSLPDPLDNTEEGS